MTTQASPALLVRELRARLGLTQEKFAAKLGVTYASINRWERAKVIPSPIAMKLIELQLRRMGPRVEDLLKQYFPDED